MRLAFTGSRTSIELRGRVVPGAEDRQRGIPGFDQAVFSRSHVLCIGAGAKKHGAHLLGNPPGE